MSTEIQFSDEKVFPTLSTTSLAFTHKNSGKCRRTCFRNLLQFTG